MGRWGEKGRGEGWQGLTGGRGSDVRKGPMMELEMDVDVDMDGGGI
jgi:hypothetical protein